MLTFEKCPMWFGKLLRRSMENMTIDNLRSQAQTKVQEQNSTVFDSVVNGLIAAEIETRANLVRRCLPVYAELKSKLSKIQPKPTGFTLVDGKMVPITPVFTPQQSQEHKTLSENIAKFDSAFREAFDKANYEPLGKLLQQSQKPETTNVAVETN